MIQYRELLSNFSEQLRYEPEIVNGPIKSYQRIIIVGMGGSRLAPDLLKIIRPDLPIHIHSDFGLPALPLAELQNALIIANSHSGATAETLSAAQAAIEKNLNVAVISSGGPLQDLAQQYSLPTIMTPDHDLPPRIAVGYNLMALMAILSLDRQELKACSSMNFSSLEADAKNIADSLAGKIPLIYVPSASMGLGYAWKVILNETAKTPAFYNRFPELDHNEIAGFDESSRNAYTLMSVLCFRHASDDRLNNKINATAALLQSRGVPVSMQELPGGNDTERVLRGFLLAHWTALLLAESKNVDPVATPVIEDLKKKL